MCPPHAITTVDALLVNLIVRRDFELFWLSGSSLAYDKLVIVPFQMVITRSDAGRALKLVAGCPPTGVPVVLGVGIANVFDGLKVPERPSKGFTVSALWEGTNCECGSRRW